MRIAEVLSIGDELTSGQRLDTNSQWLSQRLGELGARVLYHTTVADDLEANCRVFRQAIERADIVVATGGLGPTADDLTRDALAAVTGTALVLDEDSLRHIRELFARRGRDMPPRNTVQAMFPEGSRPIFNPYGTAPGIAIDIARPGGICRFFALPGVPAEMVEMWPSIATAIEQVGSAKQVIRHRCLKCFGVGESDLEQMLPDLIRRGREPSVGITVSGATISLRITASGPTPEACLAAIEPTVATIHECLGTLVFGEGEDELQHAVTRLLAQRRKTLAVVEWGTGGMVAQWLREVAGAENPLLAGLVVRDAAAAARLLDISPESLMGLAPCSRDVAEQLAAAGRRHLGADYTLAVSDFPSDGAAPDACFHVAVATPDKLVTESPRFASHPSILTIRAAKQALDLLRRTLLKEEFDARGR
jgi:nicotinamide-nucleotide amidase